MAKQTIDSTYPDGIQATLREAPIRPGLILYGIVRDVFFDQEERQYVALPELLLRLLTRSQEFTMAGLWDCVDGLRFTQERALNRFRGAINGGAAAERPSADAYELGDSDQAEDGDGRRLYTDPGELLPAIRTVFGSETERPLFILDWSHMLVTQPAHPDGDARRWIMHLGKALAGEPIVPMDSDHLRRTNGLVVLLTTKLGSLPPDLYQGDPRIRLINVAPPTLVERRSFFIRHADDVRCERPRAGACTTPTGARERSCEDLADTLADLTDQLHIADLRQILSLSMHTETPVKPERLLNLYRFGDQRSPWEDLSEEKLEKVDDTLRNRVIGQDQAVERVGTMIQRAYLGLAGIQHSGKRHKPKGTLFFVGPTGVGKTILAKASAEFTFGDDSTCRRFDMSEYNHEHSDQRLVGAPPGYVGFEEGGQLTNAVRERPFCVLLFDEIEKAHGRVLDKFLQILEDGRLTDGRGETTHFSECVIIFTSNIGAADMPDSDDPKVITRHFERAVEDHFVRTLGRPELLNRLGENIVVFQPINDDGFRQAILKKELTPLRTLLQERYGVELRIASDVEKRLLQAARAEHGGRGLVNALERDLLNPLARFLFARRHQLRRGRVISVVPDGTTVNFEMEES